MTSMIVENTALIKDIPQRYNTSVTSMVVNQLVNGGDVSGLAEDLSKINGITQRRANNIARDQNNKCNRAVDRHRAMACGIKQARWIHSQGGRHPRPDHMKAGKEGLIYDIEKGAKISGQYIQPGQLPNCSCVGRNIIPGVEENPISKEFVDNYGAKLRREGEKKQKVSDGKLSDVELSDKKCYMDNKEFRRGFHFAYGDGPSSIAPKDEDTVVKKKRLEDRERRLQNLYFEDEPYFCPVVGKTVNLTRKAKHHALDKHWEEGDGDGSITLQRLRDGVSSPNFGTEEKDRPLNRRFTLWKERGFSDYPRPSSPYKIGIKPTRLKDEFDVSTGYAAMSLQEVLKYPLKETINVQQI